MSKTLYLMRHAKSSWKYPLPDYERPLKKRGRRAAKRIGRALAQRGCSPDLILSSGAVRAEATARRVLRAMDLPESRLLSDPALYPADSDALLRRIRRLPREIDTVLLVGHNPAVSDAAVLLCGESRFDWLPTGAVIGVEFAVKHWGEISPRYAKVILELRPAELGE